METTPSAPHRAARTETRLRIQARMKRITDPSSLAAILVLPSMK
jgi:hypothetical protein